MVTLILATTLAAVPGTPYRQANHPSFSDARPAMTWQAESPPIPVRADDGARPDNKQQP
ncbi:MAG: hypothetical protein ABSH53_08620 [Holophaga sp.]